MRVSDQPAVRRTLKTGTLPVAVRNLCLRRYGWLAFDTGLGHAALHCGDSLILTARRKDAQAAACDPGAPERRVYQSPSVASRP